MTLLGWTVGVTKTALAISTRNSSLESDRKAPPNLCSRATRGLVFCRRSGRFRDLSLNCNNESNISLNNLFDSFVFPSANAVVLQPVTGWQDPVCCLSFRQVVAAGSAGQPGTLALWKDNMGGCGQVSNRTVGHSRRFPKPSRILMAIWYRSCLLGLRGHGFKP